MPRGLLKLFPCLVPCLLAFAAASILQTSAADAPKKRAINLDDLARL